MTHVRKLLATAALALAAVAALLTVHFPGAEGAYLAKITNSTNTAATNPYFSCTSAVSNTTAGAAYFAYPFADTSGTTATDVSGNNRPGTYSGVTLNQSTSACSRDTQKVAAGFNGSSSYVSGPNTLILTAPTTFSLEVWFRTTTAQGMLIGYGNLRSGTSSQYDRHLYIDTNGKLEFGVYNSGYNNIVGTTTVTDGNWHYAVATMSSSGTALYLDGDLEASNGSYTTAENHTGYWRIGYDNLSGWPNTSSNYYFKGTMAWAAEYSYALSPTQVAQHYVAGGGS